MGERHTTLPEAPTELSKVIAECLRQSGPRLLLVRNLAATMSFNPTTSEMAEMQERMKGIEFPTAMLKRLFAENGITRAIVDQMTYEELEYVVQVARISHAQSGVAADLDISKVLQSLHNVT